MSYTFQALPVSRTSPFPSKKSPDQSEPLQALPARTSPFPSRRIARPVRTASGFARLPHFSLPIKEKRQTSPNRFRLCPSPALPPSHQGESPDQSELLQGESPDQSEPLQALPVSRTSPFPSRRIARPVRTASGVARLPHFPLPIKENRQTSPNCFRLCPSPALPPSHQGESPDQSELLQGESPDQSEPLQALPVSRTSPFPSRRIATPVRTASGFARLPRFPLPIKENRQTSPNCFKENRQTSPNRFRLCPSPALPPSHQGESPDQSEPLQALPVSRTSPSHQGESPDQSEPLQALPVSRTSPFPSRRIARPVRTAAGFACLPHFPLPIKENLQTSPNRFRLCPSPALPPSHQGEAPDQSEPLQALPVSRTSPFPSRRSARPVRTASGFARLPHFPLPIKENRQTSPNRFKEKRQTSPNRFRLCPSPALPPSHQGESPDQSEPLQALPISRTSPSHQGESPDQSEPLQGESPDQSEPLQALPVSRTSPFPSRRIARPVRTASGFARLPHFPLPIKENRQTRSASPNRFAQ